MRSPLPLLALGLLTVLPAYADIRLPALISDNMVLQQEVPDNIWGWADPEEAVTVKLGERTAATTAGEDGRWKVKLTDLPAGEAGDLTISGKNTIVVKNVAVGEVWVCSGQSNMEFVVAGAKDAPKEIAGSANPLVRMFTVTKNPKAEPQEDCHGKWELAAPETVGHFSAVGYFFGRQIQGELKVPVGLIHTSWGGTPAQLWTPPEVLAADPDYRPFVASWEKTKAEFPAKKEKYDAEMLKWKADLANAQPAPLVVDASTATAIVPKPLKAPDFPRGGDDFGAPGCLYNGMIAPLLPYAIRGCTWYQGESNASEAQLYRKLFPAMITSWRERWGLPESPFLFVQLANFQARVPQPTESNWAELREAQLQTLELNHTGMALAIDVGEADDIHPKNKQEVGRRLALLALATVYYRDVEFAGPLPMSVQAEEGKIRVTWRFAEGMKTTDGAPPKGFAIAGEDRKFVWADAEISGDHVIVQSPSVPAPVAVRYGWANNPEVNLVNEAGLPASPFRSDEWDYRNPASATATPAAK